MGRRMSAKVAAVGAGLLMAALVLGFFFPALLSSCALGSYGVGDNPDAQSTAVVPQRVRELAFFYVPHLVWVAVGLYRLLFLRSVGEGVLLLAHVALCFVGLSLVDLLKWALNDAACSARNAPNSVSGHFYFVVWGLATQLLLWSVLLLPRFTTSYCLLVFLW